MTRYEKNQELEEELRTLYQVTSFASAQDEMNNILRVKQIRKTLAAVNRTDLFFNLKMEIERRFNDKVICIGSAFEADRQLAALANQKVMDYVFTNDSDLSIIGADVILNVMSDRKCYITRFKELLRDVLPEKLGQKDKMWNTNVLYHIACFLGNNFIPRNPGSSPGKVKNVLDNITKDDWRIER